MIGTFFDKMLHEDEDQITHDLRQGMAKKARTVPKPRDTTLLLLTVAVFVVALIPRLYVLFSFGSDYPGWYDDTFHHWQVAFMSKEVGFSHGFLRLWDFKGMEYFWGLLHPLVLVILMGLTGSTSILVPRLLTVFCGALVIALTFRIVRKYFNLHAALAGAFIATFTPVSLYSDTVGMQEPLSLSMMLGALLLWPTNPFLFGLLNALASMVRAEYWLFSLGIVFISLFSRKSFDHKLKGLISYVVPILIYMKYLLDHTGNAIYPIYWNFLASVKGEWFADVPLPPGAFEAQFISRIVFALALIGIVWVVIKRPKHYLFFLLGLGNILFIGFMLGFGAYIRGYMPRFWIDRLFSWPYTFIGVLLSILFLYYIPSKIKHSGVVRGFGWSIIVVLVAASQLVWPFINKTRIEGFNRHQGEKRFADLTAEHYKGGSILIPEDRPVYVYHLAHDHDIAGTHLVGQMFDPFYYLPDAYSNWGENKKIVYDFLEENDISLLVFYTGRPRYEELVKRDPEKFVKIDSIDNVLEIYEVN